VAKKEFLMKKLIAILILLAFASPVRAGLVTDFDPIEKNLVEKKLLEDDMSREFKKPPVEPLKTEPRKEGETSSSNWWKWTLGIVVIGGIAAAAGGGGGGGSAGNSATGSATASW